MSRVALGACLVAALSLAAPAGAFVQYNADTVYPLYLDSGLEYGHLTQRLVPPAVVDGFDFSSGGALCPAPGTPNYLCARFASKADLVGNLFSLHSLARVVRHDATGTGKRVYGYADTVIDMRGMASAFFPASGFVVFDFGMRGTIVSTTNNPAVTVETTAMATLQAGSLNAIQCSGGGDCTPINLHMTTDPSSFDGWHPFDEIRVELRTAASIFSAPVGVDGWDAESVSDFGDTLELLAIEIQDESHVPVPEAHIVIPDANGPGTMLEIANVPPPTTTTTIPGSTTTSTTAVSTTTTTTITPSSSSTTTTVTSPSSTTTTTTVSAPSEICGNCTDDDHNGLVDAEDPACCTGGSFDLRIANARIAPKGTASQLALRGSLGTTDLAVLRGDVSLIVRSESEGPLFCVHLAANLLDSPGRTLGFRIRKGSTAASGGLDHLVMRIPRRGTNTKLDLGGQRLPFPAPAAGRLQVTLGIASAAGMQCGAGTEQLSASKRGALRFPSSRGRAKNR